MTRTNRRYYNSAHYFPSYPNEADTNYYKRKLLDAVAGMACGAMLTLSVVVLAMFI